MIRYFLAAAVAAGAAASAPAAEYVSGGRLANVATQGPVGQSFVAEGALSSFGFQFASLATSAVNASVTFTLRQGSGTAGALVTTRTATVTGAANRAINWFDFDLTGLTAGVVAGQTYTALVSTGTANLGFAFGPDVDEDGVPTSTAVYANGALVAGRAVAGCGTGNAACDANFRFTNAVAAVPEPASWALMIGGMALIGGAARRRRARVAFVA